MIVEHPDISGPRVAAAVQREWAVAVTAVDHVETHSASWHWALGDDSGPQWFATLDPVSTSEERRTRLAAFEAAAQLSQRLSFVVAPVHTREARIVLDLAPGLVLSVVPHLDMSPAGTGPYIDDAERTEVASMLGDLHRQPRVRGLPVWRPRIGWRVQREDLERCLALEEWTGGPWSVPAGRLMADARPVLRPVLRRFSLLAAAVSGNLERWVVTHGEADTTRLLHTPDGPRLVGWGSAALAPRERDLGEPLGEAEGQDPWYAYLESGGRVESLSPDTAELFALQAHLAVVAEQAVRFSQPHEDTVDDRRCFGELEQRLGALVERWS